MSFHKWANVPAVAANLRLNSKALRGGQQKKKKNSERRLWECWGRPASKRDGRLEWRVVVASLEQNNNNNAIRYSVCAYVNVKTEKDELISPQSTTFTAGFAARPLGPIVSNCAPVVAMFLCLFFSSFFLINSKQPEHVVLSACRMFWQRTWWVGMQCCHSVPKSINCANTKRHTTRQRRQGSTQQSSLRSLRRCCLRQ